MVVNLTFSDQSMNLYVYELNKKLTVATQNPDCVHTHCIDRKKSYPFSMSKMDQSTKLKIVLFLIHYSNMNILIPVQKSIFLPIQIYLFLYMYR